MVVDVIMVAAVGLLPIMLGKDIVLVDAKMVAGVGLPPIVLGGG